MSNSCFFVNTLPEYVLDRTLIINDTHEHRISGFKLAKASAYFKRQLVELRQGELEYSQKKEEDDDNNQSSRRTRARSLCDLELKPLRITYPDIIGLEAILTYVHSSEDSKSTSLDKLLNESSAVPVLRAGINFQVSAFIQGCIDKIEHLLTPESCLGYWKAAVELTTELPEFHTIVNRYVLFNFVQIGETKEFLGLSVEELRCILREDALNSSSERTLFDIIERWISNDSENRISQVTSLLECLRLGRLSNGDLCAMTSNQLLQGNWEECSRLFMLARYPFDESAVDASGSLTPRSGGDSEVNAYLRRPRIPHSAIFVVGGWEGNQDDPNFGPSKAIQVYNSRSDQWRRLSSDHLTLDEGHAYSGCVLYKTRIYVVGGYVSSGPTQTLKVFDLLTSSWKVLSPMHEKRNYVCVCILDNVIYAIGGHNGRHRLNSVERYDIDQNHWAFVAPMRQVRSDAGSDALLGKIYVAGGFDGHHFYDSVEMFDPKSDQWTLVAPMHNIRSGVSVIYHGRYLFAIGGNDGLQRLRTVERYDPESNQWQTMPAMIRQRSNFCIAKLDGMIYTMGGWSDETNSTISLVERWTPSFTSQWESVHELYLPASANSCCTVQGIDLIAPFLNSS